MSKEYTVQTEAPSGVSPSAPRSKLRVAVEGMSEGDWLNARVLPTPLNVKAVCETVRRVKKKDGRRYFVRQDKSKNTIWVHCVPEEEE